MHTLAVILIAVDRHHSLSSQVASMTICDNGKSYMSTYLETFFVCPILRNAHHRYYYDYYFRRYFHVVYLFVPPSDMIASELWAESRRSGAVWVFVRKQIWHLRRLFRFDCCVIVQKKSSNRWTQQNKPKSSFVSIIFLDRKNKSWPIRCKYLWHPPWMHTANWI